MLATLKTVGMIVVLTLLSGYADAQGFLHAANIWEGRRLVWGELGRSGFWFALGIMIYWVALRYLREAQIAAPELQTLVWFSVTIVGVALASGRFAQWRLSEQLVGIGVIAGIGWLMLRTPG